MYNEKRRPHYDLRAFQAAFARRNGRTMTASAWTSAMLMGFSPDGVCAVIESMLPGHFYKSMTANAEHDVWQDVYHVPFAGICLYVKFTKDRVADFRLLSFKEK